MVKELVLKTIYLNSIPSTQLYLKKLIKTKQLKAPIAIVAKVQTEGIGSRNNSWISQEGNLFLSFAIPIKDLPNDLKMESASIYFAFILKETLTAFGSKTVLKWPNDFYLDGKKIGGMITTVVDETMICGVGINLLFATKEFAKLDIEIDKKSLLRSYFLNLEKSFLWKQVFSKYKLEFDTNKEFFTHKDGQRILLDSVKLEDDGSISIDGERMYSRR